MTRSLISAFLPNQPLYRFLTPRAPPTCPSMQSTTPPGKVRAPSFYGQYHGHPVAALSTIASHLQGPRIWLAGDSTLDNKYWLPIEAAPAPGAYAQVLSPPVSRRDIAYWITLLAPEGMPYSAVNCAVEESTLQGRERMLLPQDDLLRDSLRADDVLVVSVGGNDVALRPTMRVALAVLAAVYSGGRVGLATLEDLFVRRAEDFIEKLVARTRPRVVLVCMLYFLDEADVRSWAGVVLKFLGYNSRPQWLQGVIENVFKRMEGMQVEGVRVVPVPLFKALDGKDTRDYVDRVEPSEQGGRKIARLLWEVLQRELPEAQDK